MARVYLSRREVFSASHRLHNPEWSDEKNQEVFGKCNWENGHGHNYELEVIVAGPLNEKSGMVLNLNDLKGAIQNAVLSKVDHRNLNQDVKEFQALNPTAENMACVFWKWLASELPANLLYEVRLRETENNLAIYRGED